MIQSLKMKPRMPHVISSRRRMARKMAYAASSAVFSLRAPTHPTNAEQLDIRGQLYGAVEVSYQ